MKEHCQEDKKKKQETGRQSASCKKKKNNFRFVLTKPLEPNMLQ